MHTVGLMGPNDRQRWDDFVLQCPAATFFHRAGWSRVIERAFGHPTWFMYAEADGRIEAVLPLAQVRSRLFGNSLCSLPFCVYGGIAALNDAAAAALDDAAQSLARRLGVDHLEYRQRQPLRSPWRQDENRNSRLHGHQHGNQSAIGGVHGDWHRKDLYFTFRRPLHVTAEENLLAIPRKQRAMVRKGIAAGLTSVIDNGTEDFFSNYATSVPRLGTPVFSRRYFSLLQQEFGDDCQVLTVQHQGSTICGVVSFYFRDEILPYYGGGGAAARALAGNDFMYWEVMRRACERGCKLFDFGRSKRGTGSYDFKKNWGFDAQPLHYECQLHRATRVPDVQPLNPKYSLLVQAWRLLPLPLANAIGPHIVRQLG